MNADNTFHVSVGDDPEHEDLTAEIYWNGLYVALVSQEQGLDRAVIELQPNPEGGIWTFDLAALVDALQLAKGRLWDLRRIEP